MLIISDSIHRLTFQIKLRIISLPANKLRLSKGRFKLFRVFRLTTIFLSPFLRTITTEASPCIVCHNPYIMKCLLPLLLLLCVAEIVIAQDNVGIGTAIPEPSAILDLSATDKGFLIPRLSAVQRLNITSPAIGLMVFDVDSGCIMLYSTSWVNLCNLPSGVGPVGPTGSTGATGNAGTAGIAGPLGATGSTGPAGITGATGPIGCNTPNFVLRSNGINGTCGIIYDDSTNVGINNTSPTFKLSVKGSGNTAASRIFQTTDQNSNPLLSVFGDGTTGIGNTGLNNSGVIAKLWLRGPTGSNSQTPSIALFSGTNPYPNLQVLASNTNQTDINFGCFESSASGNPTIASGSLTPLTIRYSGGNLSFIRHEQNSYSAGQNINFPSETFFKVLPNPGRFGINCLNATPTVAVDIFSGGLRVGGFSGGTPMEVLMSNQEIVGSSATDTLTFTTTFSSGNPIDPVKVIATLQDEDGHLGNEVYAIKVKNITPTGTGSTTVSFFIKRLDAPTGWNQELLINWWAWY